MKITPTRENAAMLTKSADNGAPADSRPHPLITPKPGRSDQFSHLNSVSITKAEILRTAEAIKRAGCHDVLIVYTPDFVRFVVTINLPKSR
jgi:hypothetical protein